MAPTQHEMARCNRDVAHSLPIGKGWKSTFTCPTCGRVAWFALNFLGSRRVYCDGLKFHKVAKAHEGVA